MDQGLERGHVVAVPEPLVHQGIVELRRRGALLGDRRHHGVDQPRLAFVEDDEGARIVEVEHPLGLDVVVQPEHGGGCSPAEDAATCVEAVEERAEPERRAALRMRRGMHPQGGLGDHTEGALAPDEDLVEVGADGGPRPTLTLAVIF